MKYNIVELEEKIVEGIHVRTKNTDADCTSKIGSLWEEFFQTEVYARISDKVNTNTLGIYYNYESDAMGAYDFMTGCEVRQKGAHSIVIPRGKYAEFVITGDMSKAVGEFWQAVWKLDLKRRYTYDFEEYQMFGTGPNDVEIHIYIAIE